MRPPNKSRSRNKNNRRNNNNSGGNVLNRVYDSAGPDGRVRGTPVQVIEKYQALAHDNSLAGDRVAMENFQQHAEHYIRLINEAQRQIAERREQMESQNQNQNRNNANSDDNNARNVGQVAADAPVKDAPRPDPSTTAQPDIAESKSSAQTAKQIDVIASPLESASEDGAGDTGGLVETPEGGPVKAKTDKPKPKRQRRPKQAAAVKQEEAPPAE